MKKKIFTYLLFLSCVLINYSQKKSFLENSSFAMNFKLPKNISNKSFKSMIFGIANVDASYQYRIKDKFILGLGYKYGYFDVNSTAFQTDVDGKMENHNPFLKLGWISTISDNLFLSAALNSGYNFGITNISTCDNKNYMQQAWKFEPEIGLYLFSTENLAFGLLFSYNFWFSEFTPDNFCLVNFPGMNKSNSKGIYQTFCAGFGFYTLLPKKDER